MRDIRAIKKEVKRAEKLHPIWPISQIHQVAIVCEEAGEALKAALNYQDHKEPFEEIRKEIIHNAAMCLRWLENNK